MLNDDLSHFACAIVRGEKSSPLIDRAYTNYSAEVAIEVYRNNYRGNLHDALAGAYPVVKQLVGDDFFRFMTKWFIGKYPSRSANLHHYGAELANFVTTFEPAKELVYLSDVAKLEWACHVAYFVDDEAALDISKLAQITPEQYSNLVLRTHSSCHMVRSCFPIAAIWHAHQPGASESFHIDLDSSSSNALVCRKDDVVLVNELAKADAVWFHHIQAGTPLGDATAATLERHPDFDLQAALLKFVAQNVFTSFHLGATP